MKYLRESVGPLCFVSALYGAYMLFYGHLTDMVDATAPTVRSLGDTVFLSWAILFAFVAATVTYVVKASTGKAPWSLVVGTVLGVVYLLMSVWMATVAFVAGATSGEGLLAVAGTSVAIFGGISLTATCAVMLVDRFRKTVQAKNNPSFADSMHPVR